MMDERLTSKDGEADISPKEFETITITDTKYFEPRESLAATLQDTNNKPREITSRAGSRLQNELALDSVQSKDASVRLQQSRESHRVRQASKGYDDPHDLSQHKTNLSDVLKHPQDYLPIIVFSCGSFLGLLFFMMAYGGSGGGSYACFLLMVVGCWASYQLRQLVFFRFEIDQLVETREALKEKIHLLDQEIEQFDQQNELFHEQTQELDRMNDSLRGEIGELEDTYHALKQQRDEMKSAIKGFEEEIQQLNGIVKSAGLQHENLQKTNEEMKKTLKGFRDLDESMRSIAANSDFEMDEMLSQQNDILKHFEGLVNEYARSVLNSMADQFQKHLDDDDGGMSQEEYQVWYDRLPKRFQQRIHDRGISFESWAKNGIIGDDDMVNLINYLLPEEEEV